MIKRTPLKVKLKKISAARMALAVFFTAVLLRIGLWYVYGPVNYSDSVSYRRLAEQVQLGWLNYDGSRVPGYPAFLALAGSDGNVYIVQLIMGVLVTMGFFYMGWRITQNPWFGGLAGLLHQLNLGQLFFEANLLTETLATFFVIASLVGILHGFNTPEARKPWLAFLIGLAAALAILTRPLFILLPPWLWLGILLGWRKPGLAWSDKTSIPERIYAAWKTVLESLVRPSWQTFAFLLPVIGLVGIWVGFIRYHYNNWSLSTMTGYHLVQHTGAFFEYVPDEYAALRDTYLRYRDERILAYGTQTNTIWVAIPEMQQVSGLNFYDLSRTLSRISILLIREHPILFIRSAVDGWWLFWRAPVYWSEGAFHDPTWLDPVLVQGIKNMVLLQRLFLFGANVFFIATPIILFIDKRLGLSEPFEDDPQLTFSWIILSGTVWLTSVIQSLLDHGDNPRFLVPLQSLVVLWVIWWLWYRLPLWINFFRFKFSPGVS